MKPFKFVVGFALAMSICFAHALPVDSTAQGYAGSNVSVLLNDANPAGLFGATIKIVYDSTILSYVSGAPGTVRGDNPLDPLDPGVSLVGADTSDASFFLDTTDPTAYFFVASLSYPLAFGANAGSGSLMNLVFAINSLATPGTTTDVIFDCDPFGDGACLDYDFPQVSATVTVIERATTSIPLPGTLPLLSLGVVALWWARRRIA